MDKTSKLGLNLPEKGLRDWDVPINENFSLIDSKVAGLYLNNSFTGTNTFYKSMHLIQANNDKLYLKDTRVDTSSETGTDTFNTIIFRDKNDFNYANIAVQDEADGGKRLRLFVQNKLADGTTKSEQIWIIVEKDGNVVTYAPRPVDSSNGTNIAVTSWVRKLFALLTGNNTFSGTNTFTNTIRRTMSNVDANAAPTENQYIDYISPYDKNGESLGYLGIANYTDGRRAARIGHTRKKSDGSYIYQSLDIGTYADGTVYTTAPTPPTNSNNNNIATTAFVNNKFQVVSALPSNPQTGVYYFIKDDIPQQVANYDYVVDYKAPTASDPTWYRVYKSGWVEQGGFDAEGTTDYAMHTINLLKPYANKNYSLTGWYESKRTDSTTAPMGMLSFNSKSTNSFKRLTSTETYRVGLWWRAEGQGA